MIGAAAGAVLSRGSLPPPSVQLRNTRGTDGVLLWSGEKALGFSRSVVIYGVLWCGMMFAFARGVAALWSGGRLDTRALCEPRSDARGFGGEPEGVELLRRRLA